MRRLRPFLEASFSGLLTFGLFGGLFIAALVSTLLPAPDWTIEPQVKVARATFKPMFIALDVPSPEAEAPAGEAGDGGKADETVDGADEGTQDSETRDADDGAAQAPMTQEPTAGQPAGAPNRKSERSSGPKVVSGGGERTKGANKGQKCLEPTGMVERVAADRYEVQQALMDKYVKDLDEASKLAIVAWARDEAGTIIGFKVRRIRCGSPLHEAGFRNGDVVLAVNGRTIDNIPEAVKAYMKLRRKDTFRVEVQRGAQRVKLNYTLVCTPGVRRSAAC